ncbi:hypothetical protein Pcinc_007249 [Petrolisthes cinctipes]|uniref:Splicing factor Cactin n=1 Tax=Petrolisthes cinctipes TaxID=88211 RepID=A0AAE1GB79_PETCI|nr:hypothetical protein Pcinc_007249 [Petrolisthes cinctipes]
MGNKHKKKTDGDRSRSRSKECKKKRSRRRSMSRSGSEKRSSGRHSKSRSRERERWWSNSGDRERSRSKERSQMKSHSAGKGKKKSHSMEQERKRSYSREREADKRHRNRSQSKGREKFGGGWRERQRSRSPVKSRDRSRSRSRKKSRHRSRSADSYDKKSKRKKRSHSRSDESASRSSSKFHRKNKKDSKNKKKKSQSSSSSDESSDYSSSEDEFTILQRLQDERKKVKDDKISKKKIRKFLETPAEKRLRRLQKKEAKERKRKEKMGWDSEYLHFTNADNPYGDNNLLDTFVWKKKLEKDGHIDLTRDEIEKQNRAKMEENRLELEKVKKRRQERELERLEREKMMELEQRQREAAQFSQFSRQEDQFQLEQARLRSQIRIQDGRSKPIDLLAHYVSSEGDVSAVDVHEPYMHLTGLTLVDLEDLLEDIRVYMQLEKEDINQWYWTDLTIIVQDELRRLRQRDAIQDATSHRQGIHAAVASDVSSIFHNKSLAELNKLQINIESKLGGPTTGLDIGYWESLLSQLKAHQARARLRERHKDNLRKKLEMLKAEQGVKQEGEEESGEEDQEEGQHTDAESIPEVKEEITEDESRETKSYQGDDGNMSEEEHEEKDRRDGDNEKEEWDSGCEGDSAISSAIAAYTSGRYSPRLLTSNKLQPGTVVVDEEEDAQRLAWARSRVLGAGQPVETVLSAEEKVMQQEAQRAMTNDEAQFSVEAKLDPQHFLWSDKYRPRKPRYFNRVHTGFEWNKYNQTHYDMDNPPPKIVQGYKFNIFYPDLIDKAKTPQYELIPCTDNKDFAILKFTAGPPYESIAFKIVNREWEYSYKRGFRCQFHNNIFQLWFHFKRYRYRR